MSERADVRRCRPPRYAEIRNSPGYRQAFGLFTGRTPVVAAVQGSSVGVSLRLAMAAGLQVAACEVRFTANFARLGFHHGFARSVTLPRSVGQQRRWNFSTPADRSAARKPSIWACATR